jgi:hypothetical protein
MLQSSQNSNPFAPSLRYPSRRLVPRELRGERRSLGRMSLVFCTSPNNTSTLVPSSTTTSQLKQTQQTLLAREP